MRKLIEDLDIDFEYKDNRGSLVQLVHSGYSQVNVVYTKKGVVRGNHYHRLNTEAFYIIEGKCRVTSSINGIEENRVFEAQSFFRIPPNAKHCFEYLEDTVMVTMYSLGVELEDGEKDIFD